MEVGVFDRPVVRQIIFLLFLLVIAALPLKIRGGTGSPVRAVAVFDD